MLAALNLVTNPATVYVYFSRDDNEEQTLNYNYGYSAILALRVDQSIPRNRQENLAVKYMLQHI